MADETPSSGSLADRITKPLDAGSATFSPASAPAPASAAPAQDSSSWADEVASPTGAPGEEKNPLADAQVDGAAEKDGGSTLHDTQYEVQVKLSDIQGDVTSPLHSISTFEDLEMYVQPFSFNVSQLIFIAIRKSSKVVTP